MGFDSVWNSFVCSILTCNDLVRKLCLPPLMCLSVHLTPWIMLYFIQFCCAYVNTSDGTHASSIQTSSSIFTSKFLLCIILSQKKHIVSLRFTWKLFVIRFSDTFKLNTTCNVVDSQYCAQCVLCLPLKWYMCIFKPFISCCHMPCHYCRAYQTTLIIIEHRRGIGQSLAILPAFVVGVFIKSHIYSCSILTSVQWCGC